MDGKEWLNMERLENRIVVLNLRENTVLPWLCQEGAPLLAASADIIWLKLLLSLEVLQVDVLLGVGGTCH